MKKKVLFVCYGLGIGGIEKCLVNLINALPERFDIDLLLMNPQYAFKDQIRRPVRFLNLFDYVMNIEDTPAEILRRKNPLGKLTLLVAYCLFRLRIKMRRAAWVGFRPLPEVYDVAVAYSHHDFSPYYVIDKVRAKQKIMWYHNGAYEENGKRFQRDRNYYPCFDKVVAVSSDCAKVLSQKFDFREGQLLVLRNLCEADTIRCLAGKYDPPSFDQAGFHIVTVGRMTQEKGADLALESCKILREEGRDVYWHWVGDGNRMDAIRSKIAEYGLEGKFLLEGNQQNPYPYIRNAHIYVQPSYYEAYSTTITEAKVLCKPIVTTDVGGMRDQLVHGENGLIVPIAPEAIAAAVKELMDNREMSRRFIETLELEDYSPEKALEAYMRTVFC